LPWVWVSSPAVQAIRDDDQRAAQDVLTLKDEVHQQVDSALQHQAGRLGAGDERHLEVLRLEMEFVDKLKRIYALSKRIAKAVLPEAVAKAK